MKNICKAAISVCLLLIFIGYEAHKSDSAQSAPIDTLKPTAQRAPLSTKKKPDTNNAKNVLIIGEKMYLTQINDIFMNFENYKNRIVVVEGVYTLFYNDDGVKNIPAVYRRGPGCCGNDGWGGFLLKYDGKLPRDNDWIRVTGTPEIVDKGAFQDLYLNVSEIKILKKRGAEFVTR